MTKKSHQKFRNFGRRIEHSFGKIETFVGKCRFFSGQKCRHLPCPGHPRTSWACIQKPLHATGTYIVTFVGNDAGEKAFEDVATNDTLYDGLQATTNADTLMLG